MNFETELVAGETDQPIVGPGKYEIALELMREREKLMAELHKQKLAEKEKDSFDELKNFLKNFSNEFFKDSNRWNTLSLAEKEALYEIAVRDCKKIVRRKLFLVGLLNGGAVFSGIFLSPAFSLLLMLNFALWPLMCPGHPFELDIRFRFLRLKKPNENLLLED